MFDYTFKNNMGIMGMWYPDYKDDFKFNARIIFDFLYMFLGIILISQMISGNTKTTKNNS
jgi:hypothetical protein